MSTNTNTNVMALVAEFEALVVSRKLKRGSKNYNNLRQSYIHHEFDDYFGNHSALANWQRLCGDLSIHPVPESITQCRKELKRVWVNIYDFLDAMAKGLPVKRWGSERELAAYTVGTKKIYPKKLAKEGGPVRALLANIFGH